MNSSPTNKKNIKNNFNPDKNITKEDIQKSTQLTHIKESDNNNPVDKVLQSPSYLTSDCFNQMNIICQKTEEIERSSKDTQIGSQPEEEDPQICSLLHQAQQEKDKSQCEHAESIFLEVLKLQQLKYGNSSNQVASTYKKLASMFSKKRNFDMALKYYFEALKIFNNQGETSMHSSREATCLISISNIYLIIDNLVEAQNYVAQAINLYNSYTLEDEQMKPLLISQALRLKRKIDAHEKQKQFEERQIALSSEQTVCSICLEDIQKNNRVRQLNCGHVFHIQCIGQWLMMNSKCPYCRDTLTKNL